MVEANLVDKMPEWLNSLHKKPRGADKHCTEKTKIEKLQAKRADCPSS